MFSRLIVLTLIGSAFFGCTSVIRTPKYNSHPINKKPEPRIVSGGFEFNAGWGTHQTVWIRVLNSGGTKYYAQGIILPIIPIFFFEKQPDKMDFSKSIELRIHSYSGQGYSSVSRMPESPAIMVGSKKYLPIEVKSVANNVRIYKYELTPSEAPEFILLKTPTYLEDGSQLETPEIKFYFEDKIEWIYHRGP